MSMYHMVFGPPNQWSLVILKTIDLHPDDFGRFRDCFIADGKIAVYTRCGGGNREEYQAVFDKIEANPFYIEDKDDSFDSTYATFFFELPAEEVIRPKLDPNGETPADKSFREVLLSMDIGGPFEPELMWKEALAALEGAEK